MWLTLSLLTVLGAPVPERDTLYHVDEGELVVAWDPQIDPSWVGPPQAQRRLPSKLLSIPRELHLDELPSSLRGLVGSTLTLYAADGTTCRARVTSLRARCIVYDYGSTNDDDVCVFPERDAADVCAHNTFIIGALAATEGPRLCQGVLATSRPGALQMYKPLPADRAKDSEVLKAFRATGWWRAAQRDYVAAYPDEPDLGLWDAEGDAATTIRRYDPPTPDAPALAIAWRDRAIEADGGAPNQRLATVFIRTAEGWKLHRAWAPDPKPLHFFLRGDTPELASLHALARGHVFALPPVRNPDGRDYAELFERAITTKPDWRIGDISDPICTPRHLRTLH